VERLHIIRADMAGGFYAIMGSMNIVDKLSVYGGHNATRLLAGLERHEHKYLTEPASRAIPATDDAPHRADEPFEQSAGFVLRGVRGDASARPSFNPGVMKEDSLETLSAFLKVRRGVLASYRSLKDNAGLGKTTAGEVFYKELKINARDYGIDLLGFTRVPAELIFRGKHVLYPNAIVCVQEMKRSAIETAPRAAAGMEALHVYADLGASMNRLAAFIRSRGIPCQASHPLGGLLLYPALAAKAGLGYFGRQGLLVTPRFGVRQRLGVILTPLEDMPWSDSDEHKWILDFCDLCNLCLKRCPGGAIHAQALPNTAEVRTSIDNMRCAPWFSLWLGCSICVKVCPFSRVPYERIRLAWEKREAASVLEA
jgi:epoxyqueuosine reductase